ncbi:hypothetical protein CAEBREN_06238 [Caenorhabditis brenneri]|uniref:Uncharacterized protein n=1 Tax=Caenorhabditis brenneri TaxID=135651 RepID=G0NP79_CAEBE|nr:hypothetical protein CAEBREN_06238 [Caenorhabditis brenneri]
MSNMNSQSTIVQLKAELNRANIQLHQARQAIEEKDQKLKDQGDGIGKLNRDKCQLEKNNRAQQEEVQNQGTQIEKLQVKSPPNKKKLMDEGKNQDLRVALDGQKKEVDALKLKMTELEKIQSPPNTCSSAYTAQPSPLIVRTEASTQTENAEKRVATSTSTQTETALEEEGVQAMERGQVQIKEEVVEEPEDMDVGAEENFG